MPEFLNKVHAIEDSDGVTREIVPLGLQNNGYTATLPTLSADATLLTSNALDGYEQIIVLQDNGSTTAGTWLAKTDAITALEDGQVFLYKIVVAGANPTTLNITANGTALGAKTIYRVGTTKLTTQYPVGHYLLLVYNSLNTCFRVVNDSDANSYAYVRQYQYGSNAAGSGTKYPILTRYNLTNKSGTYDTAYTRFHTNVTIDTSNGNLDALSLSEDGVSLSDKYSTLVEITYASLKTLRDGGNLVSGRQYRITDYVTTTSQSNTSSAGHQFDIIVKANGANQLDENARATWHSGDTYFANSDLSAWRLMYSIDNNGGRFYWADSTNGKGVIFRMIDEFGNDLPYDFKNILFSDSDYEDAYTFSYTQDGAFKDASLTKINFLGNGIWASHNVMAYASNGDNTSRVLNFNVFHSDQSTNVKYENNVFGLDCTHNEFVDSTYNNSLGSNCTYNTFGKGCNANRLHGLNMFLQFGDGCLHNEVGYGSNGISIGANCNAVRFGVECNNLVLGDSSSTIDYCRDITFPDYCAYVYVNSTDTSASYSNQLQNVCIHSGVTGTSSNSKTITIPDRNLPYETNVYIDANGNLEIVVNSGGGSGDIPYITTAPTGPNTSGGLKVVVLSEEPTIRYDGYIYIITEPALITFTIERGDTTTHQAEEGMTWAEWCNSEYNTGGWFVSGNSITNGNFHLNSISPTDVINNGSNYYAMAGSND